MCVAAHRYAPQTKVTKIARAPGSGDPHKGSHARWFVNDGEDGPFDAIIATVGTCGDPRRLHFPGAEHFKGAFAVNKTRTSPWHTV